MIEIYTQIRNKCHACQSHFRHLVPTSLEYDRELSAYKDNQLVSTRIAGTRKARSVQQNKWVHAMFRYVAANTDDHEWNTPEKVKYMVKRVMNFFDVFGVENNQVWFKFRSFRFDEMEHNEANIRYEDAKNICAKKIGVDPEVLEAKAKREN